ncbi:MAG: hypothetical protein KKG09_06495 [Verrucomicrobia bacterium]|nr:hypothetical protein [Verrucomicrobiota bacterium]MCG2680655.1 hypothetical protein [Kiritimatiellia bacterium]MBU4247422.1 hypothetical protein [Verrucomicrobiota bacterium]MBU4291480.1 hypothetical protein [Verrucomicrobiota bacterium]MBU4429663.1 hypothetical protein [Verrucomicrobiota bacterium]
MHNLAVPAHQRKRFDETADLWLSALDLQPALLELAIETIQALLDAQRNNTIAPLIARLPANTRSHGRIRLLEVRAALAANDLDTANMILRELEVPDLREGEGSLSEIWYDLQTRHIAQRDHVPTDESLRARVRAECPPPNRLNLVS